MASRKGTAFWDVEQSRYGCYSKEMWESLTSEEITDTIENKSGAYAEVMDARCHSCEALRSDKDGELTDACLVMTTFSSTK